jgi:hypothetical protein
MDAAHVVSPSGFPIVSLLGKVATETGVSVGHLVTMIPEVFFGGRDKFALTSSFSPLLFQKVF